MGPCLSRLLMLGLQRRLPSLSHNQIAPMLSLSPHDRPDLDKRA
jgi:hypothetical protein